MAAKMKSKPVEARSGTVKNRRGLRTSARILDVATKIFIKKGFVNTSMRSVAKAAGVEIYNVQYYFPTKEHLLQAIVESRLAVFYDKLDSIAESGKSPKQKFASILEIQFDQELGSEMRGLYTQILTLAETNEFAANLMDKMFTNYRAVLVDVIKALNPSLTKRECLRRASLIAVFLEGYGIFVSHWLSAHPENKGLEKDVSRHLMRIACD